MGYENIELWDAMKTAKFRQSTEELRNLIDEAYDLDNAIKQSLALVCKTLHAEVGTFWVYNQQGDGLIRANASYGGSRMDDIKLLMGEGIAGQTIESGLSMIIVDCQKDERWAGRVDKETGFMTQTMICSPLSYKGCSFACIQIINKDDNTLYDEKDLSFIDSLTKIIVEGFVKRNMIADFMSGLSSKQQAKLTGGKVVDATTMIVDISSFNALIEKVGLSKAVKILDAFLIYVTQIIKKNGGFVDKYMGDRVMATWGALSEDNNQQYNAVKTAIEIVQNKKALAEKVYGNCGIEPKISVVINTGTVYAGVIGEQELADYTVVGESVNRTFGMCNVVGANEILVTQDVIREIGSERIKVESYKEPLKYHEDKASLPLFKVIFLQ